MNSANNSASQVILSLSPKNWGIQDVCKWLVKYLNLPQYAQSFEQLAIDGLILYEISNEDLLQDFKINVRLHRIKILEGIKQLQREDEQRQTSWLEEQSGVLSSNLQNTHDFEDTNSGELSPNEIKLSSPLTLENSESSYERDVRYDNLIAQTAGISLSPNHQNEIQNLLLNTKISANSGSEESVIQDILPSSIAKDNLLVLKALEGQLRDSTFILGSNGATLGRHSASNDIIISESFVSRKHCEIVYKEQEFWMRDLGSTTGSFIMIREPFELQQGSMIQMGLTEFRVLDVCDSLENPSISFEIFEGPAKKRKHYIDERGAVIGREKTSHIVVADDTQMSAHHARIICKKKARQSIFYVVDLGSTNHSWYRISAEGSRSRLYKLVLTDIIKIGSSVFELLPSEAGYKNRQAQLHSTSTSDFEPMDDLNDGLDFNENDLTNENDYTYIEEQSHQNFSPMVRNPYLRDKTNTSLNKDNRGEDRDLCKICFVANAEVAFVPCGHFAVCERCAVKCNYCPFCKRTDVQIMKIFKS